MQVRTISENIVVRTIASNNVKKKIKPTSSPLKDKHKASTLRVQDKMTTAYKTNASRALPGLLSQGGSEREIPRL